ncbi:hypothetical protein CISG_08892 [Coccidioides immitis RMSCC 3703]|uniref:Uncharacterized protein n=1 Tax=Coccidioides immitis RMSCC 3703 TaxID=454286 RepID=A0A0J8R939_COCIT|nr:hypothetical protein CISG_08892 [Coccidioides immitis RMSCC 3703]
MTLIPLSHDPPKRVPPPNLTFKSCMPLSHLTRPPLDIELVSEFSTISSPNARPTPSTSITEKIYDPSCGNRQSNTLQLAWEEAIIMPWD